MTTRLPPITVVTPSLNQGRYLEATIRSIVEQDYPALEYVVLDGGSTDGSVEIIRRHSARIAFWRSDRDGGQAAAINAGFAQAKGSLLGWVNSDDQLVPGSLHALAEAHARRPAEILCGDVINFDEASEEVFRHRDVTSASILDARRRFGRFHSPGIFFPKTVFERVGPFDESLRYMFDLDWFCRAFERASICYVDQPLARFRRHADQKTAEEVPCWEEVMKVADRHVERLFEPAAARRIRAENELHLAGLKVRGAKRDRSEGLAALARALGHQPSVVLSRGFLSILVTAFVPASLVTRIERRRLERDRRA